MFAVGRVHIINMGLVKLRGGGDKKED